MIREEKRDLFSVDEKYYLAHCISSDCGMKAGIATKFEKKFKIRQELLKYSDKIREHPNCILEGRTLNLITKKRYWGKPTYKSLEESLKVMRAVAEINDIKYIAMPKIGSGLDRLSWGRVREIISDVFNDSEIEILICKI